jgi:hypothetical protein
VSCGYSEERLALVDSSEAVLPDAEIREMNWHPYPAPHAAQPWRSFVRARVCRNAARGCGKPRY